MTTPAQARKDIAKDTNKGALLTALLADLDSIKAKTREVVAGAAPTTDIAISGIAEGDIIESVLQYVAGVPTAELKAEATVTSAGNIQLSTTDTTGHVLIVEWRPAPAA